MYDYNLSYTEVYDSKNKLSKILARSITSKIGYLWSYTRFISYTYIFIIHFVNSYQELYHLPAAFTNQKFMNII